MTDLLFTWIVRRDAYGIIDGNRIVKVFYGMTYPQAIESAQQFAQSRQRGLIDDDLPEPPIVK